MTIPMFHELSTIWEDDYLDLMEDILHNGDDRVDRTGVGTRAVFGRTLVIDLKLGFPLMTTKKMGFKSVLSELLWFLEGSNDERRLAEILHGTRDESKTTIWTANAQADYWTPKAAYDGDLGRVYGVQWRQWKKYTKDRTASAAFDHDVYDVTHLDQIAELVNKLKNNPTDRRMIVSAWNVGELDQMALPPCHMHAQFFVRKGKYLSCLMYQRSVDTFLGLPFNIASYALLTHMLAQVAGLEVDELIMNLGDVHIYNNHLEQVELQLRRAPHNPPRLVIDPNVKDIDAFVMGHFSLEGYESHPGISGVMAV